MRSYRYIYLVVKADSNFPATTSYKQETNIPRDIGEADSVLLNKDGDKRRQHRDMISGLLELHREQGKWGDRVIGERKNKCSLE